MTAAGPGDTPEFSGPRAGHLFMARKNLDDIPPPRLPRGIRLRAWRPGDEAAWLQIIRAAYGGLWPDDAFQRCILSDEAFRPERLLFAVDERDMPLGTAGAFQKLYHGSDTGYVHMLAVQPAHQRRGIGAALLRRCLLYFREQGWKDAVLDTEADRLPGILLYISHGFEPFIETERDRETWRSVLKRIEGMSGA